MADRLSTFWARLEEQARPSIAQQVMRRGFALDEGSAGARWVARRPGPIAEWMCPAPVHATSASELLEAVDRRNRDDAHRRDIRAIWLPDDDGLGGAIDG